MACSLSERVDSSGPELSCGCCAFESLNTRFQRNDGTLTVFEEMEPIVHVFSAKKVEEPAKY